METQAPTIPKGQAAAILKDTGTLLSFKVEDVEVSSEKPRLITASEVLNDHIKIKSKLEDFSNRNEQTPNFISGPIPGFLMALHAAFMSHYPLKLSVSDFIILIGQGLGRHIDQNAEKLRHYFVNHEGKENITIRRDNFTQGQQNDWSTVFGEFGRQIKEKVKSDIYDIVIDDTSVATPDSRIVSEITLMDCMKNYFEFTVMTLCGFPEITLEGTTDDWKKLREKYRKLIEMNKDDCMQLNFWLKHMSPVVEEICETGINRKADATFWSNIYKYQGRMGSFNPYVSGWCTVFFPYLKENQINQFSTPGRITDSQIPKQICRVPFTWNYHGQETKMEFYGGFMGARFDEESKAVSPSHFWCVSYYEENQKDEAPKRLKKKL